MNYRKVMEIVELLGILKDGESSTVEFKETYSKEIAKTICAFANTKGGRIFIGIKDDGSPVGIKGSTVRHEVSAQLQSLRPLPDVELEDIHIASAVILLLRVKESNVLVSCQNIAYVRAGANNFPLTLDEVIEKSAESLRVFFDQIGTDVPASELDKELLKQYIAQRYTMRGVSPNDNLIEIATRLRILKKKDRGFFLTNGGILCFTQDPQKYIGNATVRITRFEDQEMKSYSFQEEYSGPLQHIVDQIEKYFLKNLDKIGGFTVGFKRQEFLEYPLTALREAIINAVIHRNYFDAADIRIFIFPDRIEIRNPGSFPPGISVENPEHKPRNPQLAQYFYDLGLSEKYGSGIQKILTETASHPLTSVQFLVRPYSTTVIFSKNYSSIKLDSINQKILENLASGSKPSSVLSRVIGLSRQATVGRLQDLRSLGLIRQDGVGPKTTYSLGKSIK